MEDTQPVPNSEQGKIIGGLFELPHRNFFRRISLAAILANASTMPELVMTASGQRFSAAFRRSESFGHCHIHPGSLVLTSEQN